MRTLELTFNKNGFVYTQICREGLGAIYEQRDNESNRLIAYEVFEIQQMPEGPVGPKKVWQPAREVMPSTETWGRLGWTYHDIEDARSRLKDIHRRLADRATKKENA